VQERGAERLALPAVMAGEQPYATPQVLGLFLKSMESTSFVGNLVRSFRAGVVFFFVAAISPAFAQSASLELLYNWTNPNFAPSTVFANTYNECWGFVQDGKEYGVIGTSWGTHIFDLSDPENIRPVDSVQGAYSGPGVIHRDFEDYHGYLYAVCDEGSGISTLQIMDLRYLPDSVSVVYDSKDLLSLTHNIAIDTVYGRLYCFLVGFAPGFSSLAIYDLADPENPALMAIYNDGTLVHDGYVRDHILYMSDGYNGRILVMDWTDTDNPVVLGSIDSYPDRGYNHSGWLHDTEPIFVFADENHGALMKVLDVSDLTDINVLSTFGSEVDPMSIVHNPVFRGDYLFSACYHDGLYIHDLSDPTNPTYVAHYKTYVPTDHTSYRGAWGVYPRLPSGLIIVSDMQFGMFVFRANGLGLGQEVVPPSFQVTGVSPNPFADRVSVQVHAQEAVKGRIFLSDMQGRVVRERTLNLVPGANNLDWELGADLATGLYVLRLESGAAQFSEQLVKLGRD